MMSVPFHGPLHDAFMSVSLCLDKEVLACDRATEKGCTEILPVSHSNQHVHNLGCRFRNAFRVLILWCQSSGLSFLKKALALKNMLKAQIP